MIRPAETQRVIRRHMNGRGGKRGRKMDADVFHQSVEISAPADRHGRSRRQIFQDEVPPDDPGEEFAERGIGIAVGAARHRNHGGEFRIAKPRQQAAEARDGVGDHNPRPRIIRCRLPGADKDARPDNRPDPQRDQMHRPQCAAKFRFLLQVFNVDRRSRHEGPRWMADLRALLHEAKQGASLARRAKKPGWRIANRAFFRCVGEFQMLALRRFRVSQPIPRSDEPNKATVAGSGAAVANVTRPKRSDP